MKILVTMKIFCKLLKCYVNNEIQKGDGRAINWQVWIHKCRNIQIWNVIICDQNRLSDDNDAEWSVIKWRMERILAGRLRVCTSAYDCTLSHYRRLVLTGWLISDSGVTSVASQLGATSLEPNAWNHIVVMKNFRLYYCIYWFYLNGIYTYWQEQ